MKWRAFALGVLLFCLVATEVGAQALTEADKARLRAEYDQLQIEIAQWQKVLDETRAKKNTLQGDVSALNAQIKKAETEIRQRNLVVTQLAGEINQKTVRINTLEERLSRGRESLGKLLREKYQSESQSLALVALSAQSLSSFFADVDTIEQIDRELLLHFDELRSVRTETQKEKQELDLRRNQELDAKYEIEIKKKAISRDEQEKKELLSLTAKEEKSYQEVLAERQRRAEVIRTALFELRDAEGIPFATALEYASRAEGITGVRTAFILGILRQESNLGVNVGQCYLTDPATGAGKGKNTGTPFKNVMHATRDVPPFLNLMERLGRSAYATPVSCPQSIGYGGAMGPSQFIASTWKIYENRLSSALGVSTPDPWQAGHAIMATALFLKDLGAAEQTYSAEREAAGRYYAGGNWQKSGLGYAGSVLAFAEKYQNDIDFLKDL